MSHPIAPTSRFAPLARFFALLGCFALLASASLSAAVSTLIVTENWTQSINGKKPVNYRQAQSLRLNYTAVVALEDDEVGKLSDPLTLATFLTKGGFNITIGDYIVDLTTDDSTATVVKDKNGKQIGLKYKATGDAESGEFANSTITITWADTKFTITGVATVTPAVLDADLSGLLVLADDGEMGPIAPGTTIAASVTVTGNLTAQDPTASVLGAIEWQSVKVTGSNTIKHFENGPKSGFASGTRAITCTADAVRPGITLTTPPTNKIYNNTPSVDDLALGGVATDNQSVVDVLVKVDDQEEQSADLDFGLTEQVKRAKWSFSTGPLGAGPHTFLVYAVDGEGLRSAVVSRKVTYVDTATLKVLITGTGDSTPGTGHVTPGTGTVSKGFIPALPAANNGTTRQIGQTYTITATPGANSYFAGWSGIDGVESSGPTLTFKMPTPANESDPVVLTATFAAVPLTNPLSGDYVLQFGNGEDAVSLESIGSIEFNVDLLNVVRGQLKLGGGTTAKVSFTAALLADGTASIDIPFAALPKGKTVLGVPHLHLELTLDLSDPTELLITAHLSGIDPLSNESLFETDAVAYRKSTAATSVAALPSLLGQYNVAIASDADDAHGFNLASGTAAVKISDASDATHPNTYSVNVDGTLPDGSAFVANLPLVLADETQGDFYIRQATVGGSLTGPSGGVVTGILHVEDGAEDGELTGSLYLNYVIFDEETLDYTFVQVPFTLLSEKYTSPADGTLLVPQSDGTGTLTITYYTDTDDGDVISDTIEETFTLDPATNTVTFDNTVDGLELTFTPATGRFTGKFKKPGEATAISFAGLVFPFGLSGVGRYDAAGDSGAVAIDFNVGSDAGAL